MECEPRRGDNIRQMLEKTEVTIKNGQSQRHRQYWATHRTKREKNTIEKAKYMRNTSPKKIKTKDWAIRTPVSTEGELMWTRDEMNNLSKFQFIWPYYLREEDFRNRPIRNKKFLWQPCLLTDRAEMNNRYRGPSIYASYQVSVHCAKGFQRRRFLEIDQSETRIACGGHVC